MRPLPVGSSDDTGSRDPGFTSWLVVGTLGERTNAIRNRWGAALYAMFTS